MTERIGDAVRRELGRFGPAAAGMTALVDVWPGVVGAGIARNAWPARISRDGTLHVNADSSAWAFELAQLAPTILERLRAALGSEAPRALRFAVGRLPETAAGEAAEGAREPVRAGPAERARAAELTAEIDDDELRALVARAAAASLARPPDDHRF